MNIETISLNGQVFNYLQTGRERERYLWLEDTTIFEKRTYDLEVTIDAEEASHLPLRECEYRVLPICNYSIAYKLLFDFY